MYEIVLIENNEIVKVLHTYTRFRDADYRLNVLNKKTVPLAKKFIYRDKVLVEVTYKVFLRKRREDGDKGVIVRDEYGKILDDFMLNISWVVLATGDYEMEEQYNVTGANRKLNAQEIINHVLLPNITTENTKQAFILNNKVVIEGNGLHMITCKTVDEAIRLYNVLRVHCFDNKLGGVLFFGTIQKVDKKLWYKKIHEVTGVSYNRLYRKTSR